MIDITKLSEIYGDVVKIVTPSGHSVVIRKQCGADDDIITNALYAEDGSAIPRFLEEIIVDQDFFPNQKITWEQISKLRLADSYFIVIASRIFSLGRTVQFSYKWSEEGTPFDYEEDLNELVWDYSKPFPFEGEHYNKFRIEPITEDNEIILSLRSGKQVKMEYLSLDSEMKILRLPKEKQSINAEFLIRNLSIITDGKYQKAEHFRFFSSDDMKELRSAIKRLDKPVAIFSEIQNPETKEIINYPILQTTDFFFPREI